MAAWVREYADSLGRYLSSLLGDRARAEDLTQEVFLRAWRHREGFIDQGKVRAYLFRIADRLAIDEHRQRTRRPLRTMPTDVVETGRATPEQEAIREEQRALLQSALAELSPAQTRVLMLRYFGELSFEEIAEIVGCPVGTALSHAHRGLESLRRIFASSRLPVPSLER